MKLYFDEDSTRHTIIAALRAHSLDVLTSLEAGMNARDDESQLVFAAAHHRVLVSANARDFMTLHTSWIQQGRAHSGSLILPQQRYTTRELIRRCLRVSTAGSLENGIHFLSNF